MHNKKNEIKVASDYWESLTVARDLEENGVDTLYGYYGENEEYRVAFSKLDNGMHLAICAPLYEIEYINRDLFYKILGSALFIAFVFWVMSFYMADTIIRPLKRLTQAANEIANGNLQINLDYNSKDEVGVLARSFEETTKQLNKRIEYINSLAYTDKLTNSKNNTSYLYEVAHMIMYIVLVLMSLVLFLKIQLKIFVLLRQNVYERVVS